jgi:circadian clock protein KaiB
MSTVPSSGESSIPLLTLFVAGTAPRSQRARANLFRMLSQLGLDHISPYEVDLLEQPEQGMSHSVFATPSLLKTSVDGTVAVLYGDLSDTERLTQFLADLAPGAAP